jgi:hypothetical protein
MDNNMQPGIGDKITNLGSSLGAALMMLGGTPEEKQRAKGVLNAAPAGAPVPTMSPSSAGGGGLSGFSGIGVNPSMAGGAGAVKPLLPAGTSVASPDGGFKPLFPFP